MKLTTLIGWTAILVCVLTIFNGVLPQIQIALLDGRVPFYLIYLKFALIALIAIGIVSSSRVRISGSLVLWWLAFTGYLIFDALRLSFTGAENAADIFFGYNTLYFWILLIPFATSLRVNVNYKTLEFLVIATAIPVIAFGYIQLISNQTILPTSSVDGHFEVLVYLYYGFVRPFSIFSAPAYYAAYVSFVGFMTFAHFLRSRKIIIKMAWFILFTWIAIAEFTSYGRAEILSFALGLIFLFWWIKSGVNIKKIYLATVLIATASILVAFLGALHGFFGSNKVFENKSLFERFDYWQYWVDKLYSNSGAFSFGFGVFQNSQIHHNSDVIIDNMMIAIAVQIGVIGLALALGYMYQVWKFVAVECIKSESNISLAQLTMLSLWPVYAMFGTGLNIFPLYAFIAVITSVEVGKLVPHSDYSANINVLTRHAK
ncbi:MAG: hypothetical protein ACYCZI_03090 [Metallibacterium scheffleri]